MKVSRWWDKIALPKPEEDHTGTPIGEYHRNVADYAGDITDAQELVRRKRCELDLAEETLRQAQVAFIDHCKSIGLPIAMEPEKWPPPQWRMHD